MPHDVLIPFGAALLAALIVAFAILLFARRPSGPLHGTEGERFRAMEAEIARLRDALSAAEQRAAADGVLAARLPELETALATERNDHAEAERHLAASRQATDDLRATEGDLRRRLERAEGERVALQLEQRDWDQQRIRIREQVAALQETRDSMGEKFRLLADQALKAQGETLNRQSRDQLDLLLSPLREKLGEFQQGLATAEKDGVRARAEFAEQIRALAAQSGAMRTETEGLTRALRGRSETQGAWGEMVLATILERSGLREGEEYVTQESSTSEDGARLRPDVIVRLPGEQRVIVDSKVSLTAFETYVNATDDGARAIALAQHTASLRTHVKTLAAKDYTGAARSVLDYVVMFVPIEGALAAALTHAPDITAWAAENNVAITTPTTLMVALRTIANVWQVERRNRNADEIARCAGLLYDKFVNFIEDMQSIRKQLEGAQRCHDAAMNKLSTGNGNLVRQTQRLKELGARTSKAIPAALVEEVPLLDAAE